MKKFFYYFCLCYVVRWALYKLSFKQRPVLILVVTLAIILTIPNSNQYVSGVNGISVYRSKLLQPSLFFTKGAKYSGGYDGSIIDADADENQSALSLNCPSTYSSAFFNIADNTNLVIATGPYLFVEWVVKLF